VDSAWQVGVFSRMSDSISENPSAPQILKDRYRADEKQIIDYHSKIGERRRISGIEAWYRTDLTIKFLESIKYSANNGLYHADYGHEMVICEIPKEWKALI
jgi:hypothetical protein